MGTKTISRLSQTPLIAVFEWNFDDLMVPAAGGAAKDFGKTDVGSAIVFDAIKMPAGSIVIGGAVYTMTAFDAATYNLIVGDSVTSNRYLAETDRKSVGRTALTPTGYRNTGGLALRLSVNAADACTTGRGILVVEYVIDGRTNEVS